MSDESPQAKLNRLERENAELLEYKERYFELIQRIRKAEVVMAAPDDESVPIRYRPEPAEG